VRAERVRDTPLPESAFVGVGIGAALAGMRTIVEITTVNFSLLALEQILTNAATLLHISGGQLPVPLIIRMTTGVGQQLAAQHSHSLEGWYAHIPGIRVLAPIHPGRRPPHGCPSSTASGRTTASRRARAATSAAARRAPRPALLPADNLALPR
jgi:hypothetical protein